MASDPKSKDTPAEQAQPIASSTGERHRAALKMTEKKLLSKQERVQKIKGPDAEVIGERIHRHLSRVRSQIKEAK